MTLQSKDVKKIKEKIGKKLNGVKKDFSRLNVYLTLFSFAGISGTQKTTSKTVPPDGLSLMLILPSCAFTIS